MASCMKCETKSNYQGLILKYITNKCIIYIMLICFLKQLYQIHLECADSSCGMWLYIQTSISFQPEKMVDTLYQKLNKN
jgi:putative lipoic acid-binding regulatory protein